MVPERDWLEWHRPYDEDGSSLRRRLLIVQARIRETLDRAPAGRIAVVSMCAGQGHDLIGALADHPRRLDVEARLVELDVRNARLAQEAARVAGLPGVAVAVEDAGAVDAYAGAVPADLVLVCGVFGNVADDDVATTIRMLPRLCAPDATVVWTRHRRPPDLTPAIRWWFEEAGFDELAFNAPADTISAVGAHRFRGAPLPLEPGKRLFTFVGFDALHT